MKRSHPKHQPRETGISIAEHASPACLYANQKAAVGDEKSGEMCDASSVGGVRAHFQAGKPHKGAEAALELQVKPAADPRCPLTRS